MNSVLGGLTPAGENRKALVVEDDVETRKLFRSVLSKEGWSVDEADNGRVALERLRAEPPGVIVLDLMMPEMDGFEFLAEFHRNSEWKDIPVIVVTAKHVTKSEQRILDDSAARVIQKGTQTVDQLLEQVKHPREPTH